MEFVAESAAELVAKAFGKASGSGPKWNCLCPIHDDSNPSLVITYSTETNPAGKLSFNCKARGCDFKEIEQKAIETGHYPDRYSKKTRAPMKSYMEWIEEKNAHLKFAKIHEYQHLNGSCAFQKLRFRDIENNTKQFFQRRPDPTAKGGFVNNLKGVDTDIPYRWPQVAKAIADGKPLFIFEGEKDVETAEVDGIIGTSSFKGAPNWSDELTAHLKDASEVIVVLDNDWAGYEQLTLVAESFQKHGVKVRYIELPGVEKKGDYTDWRQYCSVEDFKALVDEAPEWTGPIQNPHPRPPAKKKEQLAKTQNLEQKSSNVVPIYKAAGTIDVSAVEQWTNSGNAKRMGALFGDKFRYVPGRGWMYWTGRVLQVDELGEVYEAMKDTVRSIMNEGSADLNTLAKFVRESLSQKNIEAALKSARTQDPFKLSLSKLDGDPLIINTQSGVVDLNTGDLYPHDQKWLCSKITNCGFDKNAFDRFMSCETDEDMTVAIAELMPNWGDTIAWITGDDYVFRTFLQELGGYTLTGLTMFQEAYLISGGGQNFKSTYIDLIVSLLGEQYAVTVDASMFMTRGRTLNDPSNNPSRLHGARLAAVGEIDEDDRLDEAKLKTFTGGTDRIVGRFMRENAFEFVNRAKIIFRANHPPRITGQDKGIKRRVNVVPFYNMIPDEAKIEGYEERLKDEWDVIFAWFVAGCVQLLRKKKFIKPKKMTEATQALFDEMDTFGQFLSMTTTRISGARCPATSLRKAYEAACKDLGMATMNAIKFGQALKKRGIEKIQSHSQTYYIDIQLRDEFLPRDNTHYYD